MKSMSALLCAVAAGLVLTASAMADHSRGSVLNFSATWCGPCQQVAPVVSKLEREGLPIRKVDIDQQRELADRYRIQGVPTFVLVVDGKEADRHVGPMTEADLRRMLRRIPDNPLPQPPVVAQADVPVQLGTPGTIPGRNLAEASIPAAESRSEEISWNSTPAGLERPEAEPWQQAAAIGESEAPSGIRRLWPFGRTEQAEPPVVRGNDSPMSLVSATTVEQSPRDVDPMASSVRIRVIIDGRINLGSGTIISSQPGLTRILTCGHIFKQFNEDSKIEVDLFEEGHSRMVVARLVKFDLESDVGLITLPHDVALPVVKVAPAEAAPQVGAAVVSIGCSSGDDPTREQLRITSIDKYEGPNNIECTGIPVRGRSGGGLFNNAGELIGVCFAADPKGQRGLYAGLFALHRLLDDCQLTQIYQPPALARTPADAPRHPAGDQVGVPTASTDSAPSALTGDPAGQTSNGHGSDTQKSAEPLDVRAGTAEVVVIIRDRSQPQAANRVVIIHQASPKFLAYLAGELDEPSSAMPVTQTDLQPLQETARRPRQEIESVVATGRSPQSAPAKEHLSPTTLSQPIQPQPYVRSERSRTSAIR